MRLFLDIDLSFGCNISAQDHIKIDFQTPKTCDACANTFSFKTCCFYQNILNLTMHIDSFKEISLKNKLTKGIRNVLGEKRTSCWEFFSEWVHWKMKATSLFSGFRLFMQAHFLIHSCENMTSAPPLLLSLLSPWKRNNIHSKPH